MALSYSITTGGTTLNKVWRKSQGKLLTGYQTMTEEWGWVEGLKNFDINISAREITTPVDLNRAYGTAIIEEGGYEANPVTPNVEEITLTWSNYNQRWTTTLTSRYLSKLGQDNKVIDQFKYQAIKAIEALSNSVGRDFYGYSTGIVCLTSTAATQASGTYAVIDAYGEAGLDDGEFLASLFVVGDRVALVRTGALVTNALGTITAINATTGALDITWAGSVTSVANDSIVFANSIENSTLAGGTNYNKSLVGLFDITSSASLHGLTHANWLAALEDTAGGRFSGVKLRQLKQAIKNKGGGTLNEIIWSNGVSNDVFALQSGALRFNDPYAMELDGEAKARGVKFRTSRKVPPGCLFGYDRSSIRKFSLLEMPGVGDQKWADGDKLQDRNAYAFSMDLPIALVCTNRRNTGVFTGLTEQGV
jgi:hypothetical protein